MKLKKEKWELFFCLNAGEYCFLNEENEINLKTNARVNKIENPIKANPFVLKASRINAAIKTAAKPTAPVARFLIEKYLPRSFAGTMSPIHENQGGKATAPSATFNVNKAIKMYGRYCKYKEFNLISISPYVYLLVKEA